MIQSSWREMRNRRCSSSDPICHAVHIYDNTTNTIRCNVKRITLKSKSVVFHQKYWSKEERLQKPVAKQRFKQPLMAWWSMAAKTMNLTESACCMPLLSSSHVTIRWATYYIVSVSMYQPHHTNSRSLLWKKCWKPKVTQPGFEHGTTPNCGGALPTELPGLAVSTTAKPYIELLHSE